MARARNIKPAFFENESLGELSALTRLFFIGMWTLADFKGCLEYRPKRLKIQLLPYDDCNIDVLVKSLEDSGFIQIYSVQGQQYIKVVNFQKHQNPHKNERESGSDIPDVSEKDNEINELSQDGNTPDKNGTARADSLNLIPDSLNLIPDSPPSVAIDVGKNNIAGMQSKKSEPRGSRLSSDWQLPRPFGNWALNEGYTEDVIRKEAEKFRDYWVAKSGRDARKVDWFATWRNWLRNSIPTGRKSNGLALDDGGIGKWV